MTRTTRTSLVECVPNFSEGRRRAVVEAIAAAVGSVPAPAGAAFGAKVLDVHADADHNRSVVTFAAPPAAAVEAALAGVAAAVERIDLRGHRGAHPRIGAADVVPFVPLGDVAMETCVELAHALGRRLADELALPVYFYGAAARRPDRVRLPDLRRGGFEGLRATIATDPARRPDAGPARVHPSAGAVAVGARPVLIAFNLELPGGELEAARAIASRIREAGGGLPGIRALGMDCPGRERVQVSTNVCDWRRTGLAELFEAVEALARERGLEVLESELVGLAPREALGPDVARRIRLRGYDPDRMWIEARLAS